MKFLILGTTLIFVVLMSCKDPLQPEIPDKSRIALFSFVDPAQRISATVSKSYSAFVKEDSMSYPTNLIVKVVVDQKDTFQLYRTSTYRFSSDTVRYHLGSTYSFFVKDTTGVFETLSTEAVSVVNKPEIELIDTFEIIMDANSRNELIRLKLRFKNPDQNPVIGYAFEDNDSLSNYWELEEGYHCSEGEIGYLGDLRFVELDCLRDYRTLSFYSSDIDTARVDYIETTLCFTSQLTEDFLRIALQNHSIGTLKYSTLVAPDDNLPSNVKGGYGAVLAVSCDVKRIQI